MSLSALKFAVRQLLKSPGFAAVAVLTLALGIGANTAVFSFVHALLLRSLPFAEPERLVRLHAVRGSEVVRLSRAELMDLQEQTGMFEDIAAYVVGAAYNASADGSAPEEIPAILTTHNLWQVLGVPLSLGGTWPGEMDMDRSFNVVLSHGLWQRRYGGRTNVLGSKLTLDSAPFYVVRGVAPPGFDFPAKVDLFRSIAIGKFERDRSQRWTHGVGRLKQGVSLGQARAAVRALGQRLEKDFPETNRGVGLDLAPLREIYVGKTRPYLLLLTAAVMLVLVLTVANVVNLLLSRVIARERELAVRLALGAGRTGLLKHVLGESLLLALVGGVVGTLLASGAVHILRVFVAPDLPPHLHPKVDAPVLLFALLVSIIAGIAAGILPAIQVTRGDLSRALKSGDRGSSEAAQGARLRRWIVGAQVAVALMVLIATGLTLRSFAALQGGDFGFDPQSLFTFRVALPWRTYTNDVQYVNFYRQLADRLATEPGISGVGLNSLPPFVPTNESSQRPYTLEGQSAIDQHQNPWLREQRVNSGYIQDMGMRLLQGRQFGPEDRPDSPAVCLVSASTAARLWPGEHPMGKRLKPGDARSDQPWLHVVGVVADVKHSSAIDDHGLDIYRCFWQSPSGNAALMLRTRRNAAELTRIAASRVLELDGNQSIYDSAWMRERIGASLWAQHLAQRLFSLFGPLSLALAAIGLYGVVSYSVRQQTRELGVRAALGAQPRDLLKLVLWQGLSVVAVGIVIGLVGALTLHRLLASRLAGLSGVDGFAYLLMPLMLTLVTAIACGIPALRAARIDPMEALRHE